MNPELDTFLDRIPEHHPLTYKAVYPKRITPPGGYINPKYFTATLWSELEIGFIPDMKMLPHLTGLMNALLHVEHRVPTYFVRSEFAQAVAQTEPPADFKLGEIKWPLPAMLFVLPTDFVMQYFGFLCPFISVANAPAGVYPKVLKNLPKCEMPLRSLEPMDIRHDRFIVIHPVYSANKMPVDYTGNYLMTMNVSELNHVPYQDATYMEEQKFSSLGLTLDRNAVGVPTEGEEETLFNAKVQNFAVKLMLALTAQPNFISVGAMARPQKIKHGRVKAELWHPNLIGWEFRAKRTVPTGERGTHASRRLHWRRGHMRNQPYGPKPWNENTLKRLQWILPMLIGADEE